MSNDEVCCTAATEPMGAQHAGAAWGICWVLGVDAQNVASAVSLGEQAAGNGVCCLPSRFGHRRHFSYGCAVRVTILTSWGHTASPCTVSVAAVQTAGCACPLLAASRLLLRNLHQ